MDRRHWGIASLPNISGRGPDAPDPPGLGDANPWLMPGPAMTPPEAANAIYASGQFLENCSISPILRLVQKFELLILQVEEVFNLF